MELIVCEEWSLTVPERNEDEDTPWFLDWVLKAPSQRSTPAGWAAYQELVKHVPEAPRVVEYFGGLGTQALMIKELWSPTDHTLYDYSPQAVAHLRENFPEAEVILTDSFDPSVWRPADLATLDLGDFTVWKSREGQKHRGLLDRVFGGDPLGVILTDIAGARLHLHRERYETLLGEGSCASYPQYLEALGSRIEALYGHTMVAAFYNGIHTATLAFAAGGTRGVAAPAPERPVGLQIVEELI